MWHHWWHHVLVVWTRTAHEEVHDHWGHCKPKQYGFFLGKYVNLSTSSVIFSIVVTAIFCSDLRLNECVTKEKRSRSVCCW